MTFEVPPNLHRRDAARLADRRSGNALLTRFSSWLVGNPTQSATPTEVKAIFALFLIISFCFNALPPDFFFEGQVSSGESGGPIKQIFWIATLLLLLSSRVKRTPQKSSFLVLMPLVILCVLMLASSAWSLAPGITLRRSILQCIIISSVLIAIMSLRRAEHVFILIYRVAAMVLLFNLFMLLRPNGFDEAGLFRGIHTHKNVLGYVGALSIITGIWARKADAAPSKHWNTIFLFGWLTLLTLSVSKTSLSLTIGAPLLAIALWRAAKGAEMPLGALILVGLSLVYAIFAVAFIAGVDVAGDIGKWVSLAGFTGRDDIWRFLLARFFEHPWLGHGYGGFWDIGPQAPNLRYGTGYVPMINQAHNGYLDLLLGLGVVGALVYVILLGTFFVVLPRRKTSDDRTYLLCWCLLLFSLLHNLTESSIVRGYALLWLIQLIALAVTYRLASETPKVTR